MHPTRILQKFLLLAILAFSAAHLAADVVETKNGARLVGKITKITDGTITLATDYAGEIAIKQSAVTSLTTDAAVAVRLASGTRIEGRVSTSAGTIQVAGKNGTVSTTIDKIAASWTAGAEDPRIAAARRHWTIETSADITGRQGNTESTGIGAGLVARLVSPHDVLKFYGSYDYATTTSTTGVKTKSADATKGGIDYQNFYSDKFGWFIRSELEKDTVAGIDLRSTTDAGASFRLIKTRSQNLVGRLGAGYRFESYPVDPNNNGAVAAAGLSYSYTLNKYAGLVTNLRYLPALKDFADYRFIHDSAIEVPLATDFWKLRLGVTNEYNSRPPGGRDNLDTTYYTRLLLKWK
jgi:hypothetical protein